MKSTSIPILLTSVVGLALLPAAACTGSPADPGTVEVMHWWTSGSEQKAIDALFALFVHQHPNEKIVDQGIEGSTNARAKIEENMIKGQPPDTFQANGGWDLLAWVVYNGKNAKESKLEPLDDLAVSEGWLSEIPGPVLERVSYDNTVYAVPLNIHRINTLYSNTSLLASGGVAAAPSTLDDLFAAAVTLQQHGITPIALGSKDPWTLPLLLFENLLVARAGGPYYHDFFLGQHSAFDPQIKTAVEDLWRLLSFTNAKPWTLTWSQAVDLVGSGQAAMTIMGDWAKAQLLATQPNLDFKEGATPGTVGTFVFTTDTFGLPQGAPNRAGARELLKLFGSREGQDTFNPLKGSIPARRGANMEPYDPRSRATITDFENATSLVPATAILAPPAFMDEMNTALANFAGGGDPTLVGNASVVIHTLDNWHDILRPSP